jgi:hypothetical protein
MTLRNPQRPGKLFKLAIISCITFFALTAAAMVAYTGGTLQNPRATHYRFFENPFSDLGRTRLYDGRSNTVSMLLFIAAMAGGAVGLAAFFVGFSEVVRGSRAARMLGRAGAALGILAAVCFLGVAATPWDLLAHPHMHFVFAAFRLLLMATGSAVLAIVADPAMPRRLIVPFAIFLCMLAAYIILLTAGLSGGAASDAVLQSTGQKIIAYAAIAMVIVQSVLIQRIIPAPAPVEENKSIVF